MSILFSTYILFLGNVTYVPRDLTYIDRPSASFESLTNRWKERRGVYFLRTTSQHCCEMTDQGGNAFSVFANGEIKITKGSGMSVDNTAAVKEGDYLVSRLDSFFGNLSESRKNF